MDEFRTQKMFDQSDTLYTISLENIVLVLCFINFKCAPSLMSLFPHKYLDKKIFDLT